MSLMHPCQRSTLITVYVGDLSALRRPAALVFRLWGVLILDLHESEARGALLDKEAPVGRHRLRYLEKAARGITA